MFQNEFLVCQYLRTVGEHHSEYHQPSDWYSRIEYHCLQVQRFTGGNQNNNIGRNQDNNKIMTPHTPHIVAY